MKKTESILTILALTLLVCLLAYKGYQMLNVHKPVATTKVEIVKQVDSEEFSKLSEEVFNLKDEVIVLKRQIDELTGSIAELSDTEVKSNSDEEEEDEEMSRSIKNDLLTAEEPIIEEKVQPKANPIVVSKAESCLSSKTRKWHSICNRNGTAKILIANNESFCRQKSDQWVAECKKY